MCRHCEVGEDAAHAAMREKVTDVRACHTAETPAVERLDPTAPLPPFSVLGDTIVSAPSGDPIRPVLLPLLPHRPNCKTRLLLSDSSGGRAHGESSTRVSTLGTHYVAGVLGSSRSSIVVPDAGAGKAARWWGRPACSAILPV